jgi:hypothetical protein
MAKRGRPSSAALLSPRPIVETQARPDACYSLPDEAAGVWQAVVEALPADWIGAEALPLLAAYCRTTVALRRLGQLINQVETEEGPMDIDTHGKLLRSHSAQAQTLKTLATSLRLTPQSRYRADAAGVKARGHNPGPRPWDR